jgi:hypothetical protein
MTRPTITRTPGRQTAAPINRQRWEQFLANRRAAHNRGNWTDGGHWMGSGREPNAFDTIRAHNRGALVLTWPTDECVQKFRDQSTQIAQRLGYGIAILAALLTRGRSWGTGLTAGLAGSWLLNQAGGIQVHRGWTYRSDNSVEILLSAHPWGRNEMTVTRVETLVNHERRQQSHSRHSDRRSLDGYPDDMIFALVSGLGNIEGAETIISCPDANVILTAS